MMNLTAWLAGSCAWVFEHYKTLGTHADRADRVKLVGSGRLKQPHIPNQTMVFSRSEFLRNNTGRGDWQDFLDSWISCDSSKSQDQLLVSLGHLSRPGSLRHGADELCIAADRGLDPSDLLLPSGR